MLMYQHTLIANLIEASGGPQTRSIATLLIRIHAKLGSSVNCYSHSLHSEFLESEAEAADMRYSWRCYTEYNGARLSAGDVGVTLR